MLKHNARELNVILKNYIYNYVMFLLKYNHGNNEWLYFKGTTLFCVSRKNHAMGVAK